jgi:hypothetical protein
MIKAKIIVHGILSILLIGGMIEWRFLIMEKNISSSLSNMVMLIMFLYFVISTIICISNVFKFMKEN